MKKYAVKNWASNRVVWLVILALGLASILSVMSPYFLNLTNLLSITQFSVIVGLLGLGQTLVILGGGGGIDLSSGAILSLSGVIMALAVAHGLNFVVASVMAAGIGLALGCLNGLLIAYQRLPALIVTLGTQYLFGSIALGITNGTPLSPFPASFADLGQGFLGPIPNQVLFVLVPIAIILWVIMRKTLYGQQLYAVGTNSVAARLVGISVVRMRWSLYAINGLLAGVAAVVMSSWLNTASPTAGSPYVLESITVAVLGGTSIFGGEGSIGGTIMAIVVVTILESGFQLANINSVIQLGTLGLLLILSVMVNERGRMNALSPTRLTRMRRDHEQ